LLPVSDDGAIRRRTIFKEGHFSKEASKIVRFSSQKYLLKETKHCGICLLASHDPH
jgi:hypothetical protein